MYQVSVVICHHKGDLIQDAIKSILKSRGVEVQLIVVTSNRTFRSTLSEVIYYQGGPAAKRNLGLKFCKYDLIAFFDDDVEVTPTAIFEMAKLINKDKVGMVFGKLLNMEHRTRFDEAGSFLTWSGFLYARCQSGIEDVGQFDEAVPVLAGKSASCMIRRKAFSQAGFFDEDFWILGEETDLAWRVWLKGWRVFYCPSSVTYHAFNTKFKPVDFYSHERVYTYGCRNYMTMLVKNLSLRRLALALPCQLGAWTVSSVGMACSGKFSASFHILKGMFQFFIQLPKTIKKRTILMREKTVYENAVIRKITLNPPLSYFFHRLIRYFIVGLHG